MWRSADPVRLLVLLLSFLLLSGVSAQSSQAQEAHVELILDASGSMFNRLDDDRYRIVAAKEVLAELISALPAGGSLNVGFRAYGAASQATAAGACEDSVLYVPVEGVQRQLLLDTVRNTQARGATPIAYSLELALADLQDRAGRKLVVLITDGEEGCGGDVRAAAQALQAAGIDLRVIGFDLDAAGSAAFEGIGVFENATSAAELLAALNRAVVHTSPAPAAPSLYPVTVTLLREGEAATDGPVVQFVPAVGDEESAESFAPQGGAFHAELSAGAYVARVFDAHSAEPLTVSGLAVTPEGPNEFEFELAPRLGVTLTPDTATPNAGATLTVAWEGAPDVENGYIALTPAGEDVALIYLNAPGASGEGQLRLPIEPGAYDLRYLLDRPSGGTDLLGLTTIELGSVTASLEAPAEVGAGSPVQIHWEGPDNQGDYVTIVPAGAPLYTWDSYVYTADANPAELRAPPVPGDYEVRYLDGYSNMTLASVPMHVTSVTVAFTAPSEAVAGSVIVLDVTQATTHPNDYITLVEPGSHEHEWGRNYTYIDGPGQYELITDEVPGEYLLRYQTETPGPVLATQEITITPASALLSGPATVGVGEAFEVHWEGPGNGGDFITIVPAGASEGDWGYSMDVSAGSPLELYSGDEPGEYELRYVTGQLTLTLARQPITVR